MSQMERYITSTKLQAGYYPKDNTSTGEEFNAKSDNIVLKYIK